MRELSAKKKLIAGVLVLVTALSTWLVYSKVTQAQREASYRSALAPFKRDLTVGMPKAKVEEYLRSRDTAYHVVTVGGHEGESYLIKIGEESDNLVCEPWNVYVALDFGRDDTLKYVYIDKIGTCL